MKKWQDQTVKWRVVLTNGASRDVEAADWATSNGTLRFINIKRFQGDAVSGEEEILVEAFVLDHVVSWKPV